MINLHPLYSSSSGNSFHIDNGKDQLLIDAGVTYKALCSGLKSIHQDFSKLSAVLITHEHSDHIKGLPLLCRKNRIPIYACGKTADYLKQMLKESNITADIYKVEYDKPFRIKDFEITPFETPHDAVMPCGYRISSGNKTLTYATDLGHVTSDVYENLQAANYCVLEANYDIAMLDFGKYPFPLKRRIKSPMGHLSNDLSAATIVKLIRHGQTDFLLAHLSENNNTPFIASNTIPSLLLQNDIDPNLVHIHFASKSLSSEEYQI